MKRCLLVVAALSAGLGGDSCIARGAEKPNVLFIAVDDLNHWVGHLGRNPQTKTPNIDRLAKQGVTFTRAYCTAPACNPSRAALMSGQRPSTTGFYVNSQTWRPVIAKTSCSTRSSPARATASTAREDLSRDRRPGRRLDRLLPRQGAVRRHPDAKDDGVDGIKFYPLASSDEEMPDYGVVSYGLEKLGEKSDKPFFLAVGLVKPHMPWNVPKKWYDLFPLDTIELPPAPRGRPRRRAARRGEDGRPAGRPREDRRVRPLEGSGAGLPRGHRVLRRAGRPAARRPGQVARIATTRSSCFWGDHGWSLGEK